ncbi:MAG: transcriptional regulator [Sphingosinicella sp.]|nr:transcriptional regulator [Sphingosinicella sp.]
MNQAEEKSPGSFQFEHFVLDPGNRQLRRDDVRVELSGRYYDALALLVREHGKLVSKDQFLAEVWRGVPVTDEALTQCIKTLRRQLGDSASDPRFIETIPKHGYRFIAPVDTLSDTNNVTAASAEAPRSAPTYSWRDFLLLGGAATLGGGIAGIAGGLFYGLGAAYQPLEPNMGAASILLVLLSVTIILALIGAAGVGFGIAAAGFAQDRDGYWKVVGGAVGGLVVGALVKLLGIDAFTLFFGQSPGDITGPAEGVFLGGAVGLGAWLGDQYIGRRSLQRCVAMAGLSGGVAGILIALLGGRLLGGSLDLLARSFPDSRLSVDPIGALFGEAGFGPVSRMVTSAMESMLFGGCVAGAIFLARRSLNRR